MVHHHVPSSQSNHHPSSRVNLKPRDELRHQRLSTKLLRIADIKTSISDCQNKTNNKNDSHTTIRTKRKLERIDGNYLDEEILDDLSNNSKMNHLCTIDPFDTTDSMVCAFASVANVVKEEYASLANYQNDQQYETIYPLKQNFTNISKALGKTDSLDLSEQLLRSASTSDDSSNKRDLLLDTNQRYLNNSPDYSEHFDRNSLPHEKNDHNNYQNTCNNNVNRKEQNSHFSEHESSDAGLNTSGELNRQQNVYHAQISSDKKDARSIHSKSNSIDHSIRTLSNHSTHSNHLPQVKLESSSTKNESILSPDSIYPKECSASLNVPQYAVISKKRSNLNSSESCIKNLTINEVPTNLVQSCREISNTSKKSWFTGIKRVLSKAWITEVKPKSNLGDTQIKMFAKSMRTRFSVRRSIRKIKSSKDDKFIEKKCEKSTGLMNELEVNSSWGELLELNGDGSQTILLKKTTNKPFGLCIARGNVNKRRGLFVSRMREDETRNLMGLIQVGDQIIGIDDHDVQNMPINQVNQFMMKKEIVLKIIPFIRH